jgi:hypothetical protein
MRVRISNSDGRDLVVGETQPGATLQDIFRAVQRGALYVHEIKLDEQPAAPGIEPAPRARRGAGAAAGGVT